MNCDETKILLAEYWSQSLGEAQELAFEAHLATCDECRTESDRLGAMWKNLALIPGSSKDFEPSSAVRARFYESLGAFRQGLESAPKRSIGERLLALWPKQPAFQMAASFAMLAVGLGLGYEIRGGGEAPKPASSEVAQLKDEVSSMRQMVALSLMQQQSAGDRLKGVSYAMQVAGQMPTSDTQVLTALLTTINQDDNVNVRLSAVDALHGFGSSPVVREAVTRSIAKQKAPIVQIALIDLLVDLKEHDAIGSLKEISNDLHIDSAVRERAKSAMEKLR